MVTKQTELKGIRLSYRSLKNAIAYSMSPDVSSFIDVTTAEFLTHPTLDSRYFFFKVDFCIRYDDQNVQDLNEKLDGLMKILREREDELLKRNNSTPIRDYDLIRNKSNRSLSFSSFLVNIARYFSSMISSKG